MLDCTLTLTDCTFVSGRVASHQLRVHAQITTGKNMVEAVGLVCVGVISHGEFAERGE